MPLIRLRPWFVALAALLALHSGTASALSPADFAGSKPEFDPIRFFTGHTVSWGVFEDRDGEPTKRITTETWGRMAGGELRMEQDLWIEKQPRQHRSWQLRRIDAHHFEGGASDIVGAPRGTAYGNFFEWTITVALKPGNPLFNVQMTQHMYLQPDGRTMINRDVIRKYGIIVAEVTEEFRHESARRR